jgi:hypothetical protein
LKLEIVIVDEYIEVAIYPDLTVKVEAHGMQGSACLGKTAEVRALLGDQTGLTLKPEFHQVANEEVVVTTQKGTVTA